MSFQILLQMLLQLFLNKLNRLSNSPISSGGKSFVGRLHYAFQWAMSSLHEKNTIKIMTHEQSVLELLLLTICYFEEKKLIIMKM